LLLEKSDVAPPIREFLCRNFLFTDPPFPLADEDSLLEEGVIDSLGIMELATFVETQFGISVADSELVPQNFDSIAKLSAFILDNTPPTA
jgi:acyl carrier protein